MKKDVKQPLRDDAEPVARRVTGAVYMPMWLTGLLGLLLYWGCYYVDENGGKFDPLVFAPYKSTNELASVLPPDPIGKQIRLGEQVYTANCVACHQATGLGAAGIAPPLGGSEWVTGPAGRTIRIPMRGLAGPIKVNGVDYNLNMLSFHDILDDEKMAAVVTFIRNSFGNKASAVTVDEVKKVRDAVKDHPDQFTAEELLKVTE
jgi:mono/diheme cytochrome c family protein